MNYENMVFDGEIKALDERKKIAVKNESNEIIGAIIFNPNDTKTYEKFINIMEDLTKGYKELNELENVKSDTKLETIEDFDNAGELFSNLKKATQITGELIDKLKTDLDSVFGEGVCDLFLNGANDVDLLTPMLNIVMPYFQKAREEKTAKYKSNKQSSVIK